MTTHRDYTLALHQARIATRRGDIASAEHWLKIAERCLAIRQRKQDLDTPPEPPEPGWRR